jgi:large subunit ribosomal protein L29
MASKEIRQLRKKTEIELKGNLSNLRGKLKQLRFDLAAGKVKNVREMRKIKKEIARILTLLKEVAGKKNK